MYNIGRSIDEISNQKFLIYQSIEPMLLIKYFFVKQTLNKQNVYTHLIRGFTPMIIPDISESCTL